MPPIERRLRIINDMGIHARPATQIVELTNKFTSKILFRKGDEEADAKSIFGVMMLAAVKGTELLLLAEGEDAAEAADAVEGLFLAGFGELGADRPQKIDKPA